MSLKEIIEEIKEIESTVVAVNELSEGDCIKAKDLSNIKRLAETAGDYVQMILKIEISSLKIKG